MNMKLPLLLSACLAGTWLPAAHAALVTVPGSSIKGGELVGGTFTEATPGTVAATNNHPAGEPPAASIDGVITTKYLNFAKEDTGYIVIPSGGASIVTGIDFVTANDSTARDPASYILYGSNSVSILTASLFTLAGNGFTQISTGALALPNTGPNLTGNLANSEGRGQPSSVTFANSTAYTSYILTFPTLRDTATANSMQIAEAVLTGTVVPEPSAAGFLILSLLGALSGRRRQR